tara:strand:- start:36076 stop:36306 length:231 start_codon:yes stop_codon:yes gene_type:complete
MFKGIMIRIGRIVFNMSDDFMDGWNKQKLINQQAKDDAHREKYPASTPKTEEYTEYSQTHTANRDDEPAPATDVPF